MQNSQSEGSDLIGSNTADAVEDADPSKEAEDCSCWVTAAGVSVVRVSGVALVTSEIKQVWDKIMLILVIILQYATNGLV